MRTKTKNHGKECSFEEVASFNNLVTRILCLKEVKALYKLLRQLPKPLYVVIIFLRPLEK